MADADEWAEFRRTAPKAPAHDEWADFRAPETRHEPEAAVLPDMAKSAGIGLAKGAIGIPALPGNSIATIDTIRDWIAGHLLGHSPEDIEAFRNHMAQVRADQGKLPFGLNEKLGIANKGGANIPATSRDIQEKIEPYTGKFYEPQTRAGHYTDAVAEFVPMALSGGAGLAGKGANLVKGALAPGVASEAAGEAAQGTSLEPIARLAGGLAGGLGAHGVQVVDKALGNMRNSSKTAGEVGRLTGVPDVTGSAVRLMGKDVRNEGLDQAIAQQRMDELGPEGMMLDAGRQQLSRAQGIATEMGPGQTRLLDAVEGRTGDFGDATAQRIKSTLNTTMGQSPDVVATTKAVADLVDKHAKPLYDAVMEAHPDVAVPNGIAKRPAVVQGMRDAESIAKNYNEPLSQPVQKTTLNAAGVPVTQTVQQPKLDLRYWDNVKKAMDSRISGMLRTGGVQALDSAEKADLGGLIAARNSLRDHLDTVTTGAYADARRVAATKPQLTEALEHGQAALNTKLLPEELKDLHDNMSIPQQAMLRMGMRREVERIIDTARNDGAAARRILDTNQNREKIAEIFGQKAADAIDKRIGAETQFQKATQKVAGSSETAFRESARKDTESPSVATPPSATFLGYGMKGVNAIRQNLADAMTEKTRAAIGGLSTVRANQVPDLVRILSGYNARAAANARPPTLPFLSNLGRTLAVNEASRLNRPDRTQPSP
jgi:hypothetical protein